MALLLAFSFSATSSRNDLRQRLVLEQANAVGTCYLRAGLLEEPNRSQIRDTLRHYVDLRLEHYSAGHHTERAEQLRAEIDEQMANLWEGVESANRLQPDSIRNSQMVPAANAVIDQTPLIELQQLLRQDPSS